MLNEEFASFQIFKWLVIYQPKNIGFWGIVASLKYVYSYHQVNFIKGKSYG